MFLIAQVSLPAIPTAIAASSTGIDINQIVAGSGGNPVMVLALGAVALLGGKVLWDFLKRRQELAHEEKMESMKIQQTGHEACLAKQQATEESLGALKDKISDLDAKATTAEKKVQEIEGTSNEKLEDLKGKISKLEKKVVPEQAADKGKPKKKTAT